MHIGQLDAEIHPVQINLKPDSLEVEDIIRLSQCLPRPAFTGPTVMLDPDLVLVNQHNMPERRRSLVEAQLVAAVHIDRGR
jgi:hypothetical protein